MKKKNFIPFCKPTIGEEEINEVVDTLKSGWITTGPKVKIFEDNFALFTGSKYAIAVNSCTAGLHLALEAIGLKEGDEVITTPMTFATTAEVIEYFNAKPVFVDIEEKTWNIDVSRIEKKITKKTRAILPVHFAGKVCEMKAITSLAEKHDLKVIEDAAHSLPALSVEMNKRVGSIGDITSFSFYATKTITTGEGGMITTDDKEYADRMRVMSLHGMSVDAWKRYEKGGSWYYEIIKPGFKYNMTDIAAALGIVQLRKANDFYKRRVELVKLYNELFSNNDTVLTPYPMFDPSHAWHLYIIRLKLDNLKIGRDQFIAKINEESIGTSVHFIPLHIHPYYRDKYNYEPSDFPVAHTNYLSSITLPLYPGMNNNDCFQVAEVINDLVEKYSI